LRDGEAADYDLSSWRVAGVGAEMIRTEALDYFAEQLAPSGFNSQAFLPCYGMAECSLAVCFGPLDKGVMVDHIDSVQLAEHRKAVAVDPLQNKGDGQFKSFVNCGGLMPGYEFEIRNKEGQILPERHCGTLYLRGPSVMSGYFGDIESTLEVLSSDGWLDTGDIAYQVGPDVFVTGRLKDMIIINGRNIWPQDIEYLAESQSTIRTGDAMAFFVPNQNGEEQAIVMVECRENDEQVRLDLVSRLNREIRQELGIDCLIELVPRNTLMRTTSGKPSRHATKNDYLQQKAAEQNVTAKDTVLVA
jgi:fatty-acyl-CoA synthase